MTKKMAISLGATACARAVIAGPDAEKIKADGRKFVEDKMWGFDRIVFDFEGCEAWLVEPEKPAADGRWVWCMEWPGAFQDRTGVPAFLKAGYRWVAYNPAHVGILEPEKHKNLPAGDQTDEMIARRRRLQAYLVKALGLKAKCGLVGMSWGGFYSVRYASTLPRNVNAMYLDAPLLDFSTLPDFSNVDAKTGEPSGLYKGLRKLYGFAEKGYVGADDPMQSVNRAEPIAKAGIPILLLYGGRDTTVPPERNCLVFAPRFEAAGGELTLVRRSTFDHHPHGLEPNETPLIVNFFNRANAPKEGGK